jgi:outer membrane immunogenic protein
MRRIARLCLTIGLGWMSMTAGAQQAATPAGTVHRTALEAPVEVSYSYDYARANAGPGQCGCFNMNGGSMEVAVHAYRGFSAVADLGGEWAGSMGAATGTGLSLSTLTAGPRYSQHFAGKRLARYTPFAQGLVGGARGFGSIFPGAGGVQGSATSLAVLAGGGLDVGVNRYLALRPIQADYLMTQLPNSANNKQNLLRLGAGIVLRAW